MKFSSIERVFSKVKSEGRTFVEYESMFDSLCVWVDSVVGGRGGGGRAESCMLSDVCGFKELS